MIAGETSKTYSPNMQQAPKFNVNIVYSKWKRDFKAFIRRIPDCDFVPKNMTKPAEPVVDPTGNETREAFKKNISNGKSALKCGNVEIQRFLHTSILRSAISRELTMSHERGTDALSALKKEFENTNAVKEQAEDLRAEFDIKKMEKMSLQQCGFQSSKIIDRLRNLGDEISDETMANKIRTSLVSEENKSYVAALTAIIMRTPTITLLDLRRLDEIIFKNDLRPVSDSFKEMVNFSNHQSGTPRFQQRHQREPIQSSSSFRQNPNRKFESTPVIAKSRPHIRTNKFQKKKTGNQIRNLNIPPPPIQAVNNSSSINCGRCEGRNHTAENCKLDWSIAKGKRSPQETILRVIDNRRNLE
jgi:hypothetical protein